MNNTRRNTRRNAVATALATSSRPDPTRPVPISYGSWSCLWLILHGIVAYLQAESDGCHAIREAIA